MKAVVAFDSYKGSLSAMEACKAAEAGVRLACPDAEVVCLPLSDGGEGLTDCLTASLPLRERKVEVTGPMGGKVMARYAMSEDGRVAYMEMAQAAGLTLVDVESRNPMMATTYGVGEMLLDAAKQHSCRSIIIGLGGSATCDGGMGMIECLRQAGWTDFGHDKKWHNISVSVVSDVNNPLCGEWGAARVYAPQKGATEEQVELLEQRLMAFAESTEQKGIAPAKMREQAGAGAAGGLGYALMAYLGASMFSGIDFVLDTLDFDKAIVDADWVMTGEGRSDVQTLMGKVASGVLERARRCGVPCCLLSGQIEDEDELTKAGFASVGSIHDGDNRPAEELMQKDVTIAHLTASVARLIRNRQIRETTDMINRDAPFE